MAKTANSRPDPNPTSDKEVQAQRDQARRDHDRTLANLDNQPGSRGGAGRS